MLARVAIFKKLIKAQSEFDEFDAVYQAAKRLDSGELQRLVTRGVCVDVLDEHGLLTPAGKLAADGHERAAQLLLNQFGANVHNIALGATFGRRNAYIQKLKHNYAASYVCIPQLVGEIASSENHKKLQCKDAVHDDVYVFRVPQSEYKFVTVNKKSDDDWAYAIADDYAAKAYYEQYTTVKPVTVTSANQLYRLLRSKQFAAVSQHLDTMLAAGETPFTLDNGTTSVWKLFFVNKLTHQSWSLPNEVNGKSMLSFTGSVLAAIASGQLCLARSLFENESPSVQAKILEIMFTHAISAGHLGFAVEIYNKYPLQKKFHLERIIEALSRSLPDPHGCELALLHQLSFIKDISFLEDLVNSIKRSSTKASNFLQRLRYVIPKAIKINSLMQVYGIAYDQAVALLDSPHLHTCLMLICKQIEMSLPLDEFILIAKELTALEYHEVRDLYEKMQFTKYVKEPIRAELEAYLAGYWIYHRERAHGLLTAVQSTTSRYDLAGLMTFQKALFAGVKGETTDASKADYEQPLANDNKTDGYFELINRATIKW